MLWLQMLRLLLRMPLMLLLRLIMLLGLVFMMLHWLLLMLGLNRLFVMLRLIIHVLMKHIEML